MPARATDLVSLDAAAGTPGCSRPLFGLDSSALSARMAEIGEPAWRGKQLSEAIYNQSIAEISAITTLPKSLRDRLAAKGWQIGRPAIVQAFQSVDGTERYLIQCSSPTPAPEPAAGPLPFELLTVEPLTVETVWMPEGDGGDAGDDPGRGPDGDPNNEPRNNEHRNDVAKDWRRATICVSSQVGCAVNCQFCLTARLGLQRNLTAGEIAGQVVAVLDRQRARVGRDRVNLVFMGMGEPFLNYDNFMAAVRLLVHEVGLSPQRMTVSTSGIVPGIERFAQEPADIRPRLAISLNAPNDEIRTAVMPINRKWSIAQVIDAVQQVPLRPRERVTFEYVLLGGVTDRPQDARELARLVRRTGLPAKVNLIAWNPGPGIDYSMPQPATVEAFHQLLMDEGIHAFIRQPRGRDIFAACGQLKRTVEG